MTAFQQQNGEAGAPQARRLFIPAKIDAARLQASRVLGDVRRMSGATMGTGWSLSFASDGAIADSLIVEALETTFTQVISELSGWDETSALSRFNRAGEGWFAAPSELFRVVEKALEIARATQGAFDPCLAREVQALGFGPAAALPSGDASWRELRVDEATRSIYQPGGAMLDLSSIAKGHAVDLCVERLEQIGLRSFLMEIGGEFAGRGARPDGQPWRVDLQLSDIPAAVGEGRLSAAMVGQAVATSGDFVRRHERDGKLVSHLLDGRTGAPVGNALSGLCVFAPVCMDVDGWATALGALGPEEGMAMAEARGLAAIFAVRTPEGARYRLSSAAREMEA